LQFVVAVFSNASDEAVVNEQSAGSQLLWAWFTSGCVQHCYWHWYFAAVRNAAFCSQLSAHVAAEFWVSM